MITVHTKKQCLYALMHCSCPMNTALGAGPKKKRKNGWNAKCPNVDVIQTLT